MRIVGWAPLKIINYPLPTPDCRFNPGFKISTQLKDVEPGMHCNAVLPCLIQTEFQIGVLSALLNLHDLLTTGTGGPPAPSLPIYLKVEGMNPQTGGILKKLSHRIL
jgi:hypothetical protein